MKLINIMTKGSNSTVDSGELYTKSKFRLGNLFRRRSSNVSSKSYSSNDTNSYISSNSVFDSEAVFEGEPTPELEEEQQDEYDAGFETDDLTSIDSMDVQSLMSEPQFKQFNGYKKVVHSGRNITRDWEMRYDNLIGQFYYINKADNSITINSTHPISAL